MIYFENKLYLILLYLDINKNEVDKKAKKETRPMRGSNPRPPA